MTNKCTVSKFNGILQNDTLPVFDTLVLNATSVPDTDRSIVVSSVNVTIPYKIVSQGSVVGQGNVPSGSYIAVQATEYPVRMEIKNKYELTAISFTDFGSGSIFNNFDFKQFRYCESLASIDFRRSTYTNRIEELAYIKSLTSGVFSRSYFSGRIEDMVETYISNYPTETKDLVISFFGSTVLPSFNSGSTLTNYKISFIAGSAVVYDNSGGSLVEIGSYDGTLWTYD